jgi:hypothetical protein
MLNIDDSIIKRIAMDVEGLCRDYRKDLNEAFMKTDDALMVSFKSKISPDGVYLEVETSIEFTKDKIKGKTKHTCGGLQGEIVFEKPVPKEEWRLCDTCLNDPAACGRPPDAKRVVACNRYQKKCPHDAFWTREETCSVLSLCSFLCMDRCRNGERIKKAA